MPEGDTLYRTADGLRPYLAGRLVTAAHARPPGPQAERLVGARVTGVEALGKNLLIRFDHGLELRTHLGLHGSWHRYRPGERWRRPMSRARLILEVPGAVAVCFDAPVVELFETRTEKLHPAVAGLGPDVLAPNFDTVGTAEALRRLREPGRAKESIAEALVDQRVLAGIGNVYKSEILFIEAVDPWAPLAKLDDSMLSRLVGTARRLMVANAERHSGPTRRTTGGDRAAAGQPLWVYGRAGRPCRRCGTLVARTPQGVGRPRLTYWCPNCQRSAPSGPATGTRSNP